MHFEGRRRATHLPNLTPLIDIVFLLLVFFMLTSHFVREKSLEVDLPQSESGAPLEEVAQIELVLDADGALFLQERPVEPEALEGVLRQALAGHDNKVVRIRGDREATVGKAVSVLDVARRAGAEAVDIVTEAP